MRVVDRVATSPEGFEPEVFGSAARSYRADSSKAKRELGIEHRPLEEGLRDYLEWEIDQMEMDLEIEPAPIP